MNRMNDLISRISLKQSIAVSAILKDKKTLEQIIDEEPSIDAVPVVRCKDCKQCRKTILFGHFATVCDYWIKLTDDDGYCNNAERKES